MFHHEMKPRRSELLHVERRNKFHFNIISPFFFKSICGEFVLVTEKLVSVTFVALEFLREAQSVPILVQVCTLGIVNRRYESYKIQLNPNDTDVATPGIQRKPIRPYGRYIFTKNLACTNQRGHLVQRKRIVTPKSCDLYSQIDNRANSPEYNQSPPNLSGHHPLVHRHHDQQSHQRD